MLFGRSSTTEPVERALRDSSLSFVLCQIGTHQALEATLAQFEPDLILADDAEPVAWPTTLETVERLAPGTPLVLWTRSPEPAEVVERIRAGAANVVELAGLDRLGAVVQQALRERRVDGRRPLEGAEQRLDQALLARNQQEDRLRALSRAVEQSPVSIVITDTQGRIEYVNPKFTQVTGYTLEEAFGQNPRFLKSGETPAATYRQLWSTISGGGEWRGELHNRKKNGELFWEDASISPIRDAGGQITHYLAVKEDITERKLLEDQLRQAQKMEAVGQLAGGVAHDFNNILNVILGYGELVLRRLPPGSSEHRQVQEIHSAAQRAAGLTRQLLAFSRKQVLQPKLVDLNLVIGDLEFMLRRLLGEHIDLRIMLAPELWPVLADPGQIQQVLVNLAVNGRDAMPGGGTLTIESANVRVEPEFARARRGLHCGDHVRITVRDTGLGIAPAAQDRIFEPFFTTKELGRGTGLGLATAYGIVKQSGGGIYFDSQAERGTAFEIYLPRVAGHADDAALALEAVRPVVGGHEAILHVEDDRAVRDVTREILLGLGYEVVSACNGAEALELVERRGQRFDLLLTDVVMPGMSGRELAERLRRGQPNLRVLFASGYPADVLNGVAGVEAESALVHKPYRSSELAAKIRELLSGAGESN